MSATSTGVTLPPSSRCSKSRRVRPQLASRVQILCNLSLAHRLIPRSAPRVTKKLVAGADGIAVPQGARCRSERVHPMNVRVKDLSRAPPLPSPVHLDALHRGDTDAHLLSHREIYGAVPCSLVRTAVEEGKGPFLHGVADACAPASTGFETMTLEYTDPDDFGCSVFYVGSLDPELDDSKFIKMT
ncbi:hypothetical protein HPB50_016950 [Hyalomma asiaticum]|uniref:Uncharacterized protein n=1 Tax=Hyalomma asiaticum TaxID=266040 RepID=A0ACB7RSN0_HYAAI|nr:hypothetical protein HPB50_016950 [Hyalomma asiaticum]